MVSQEIVFTINVIEFMKLLVDYIQIGKDHAWIGLNIKFFFFEQVK